MNGECESQGVRSDAGDGRALRKRLHPLGAGYDCEWPPPRKLAYAASVALTGLWGLALAPYSLAMIFTGAFLGDDIAEKLGGAWESLAARTPVGIGLSTPALLIAALIWALVLRHRGWYARSVTVQLLPAAPPLLMGLLGWALQLF